MVKSKIIGYTGKRGSGKTLTMTKDLYNYHKQGFKVYSNYNLNFAEQITTEELHKITREDFKFSDCVIAIDEIQIIFDSSRYMAKENKNFSNFVQQIRKRNIILLYSTQFIKRTDVRIRENTDIIVRPNYNEKYDICDSVYYDVTENEEILIFGESGFGSMSGTRVIFSASDVFDLYDTKQKII